MGRNTKLTRRVKDYICAAVEQGANVEMRCLNGGIVRQTYHNWIARGREARVLQEKGQPVPKEERLYLSFLDAIDEAEAGYGLQLQQVIAARALYDPAEARRELQRLFPNDYAPPPVRQEIAGVAGGPMLIQMTWGDDVGDGDASPD